MKPTPALLLTLLITAMLTPVTGGRRDWRQALLESYPPVGAKQRKILFSPSTLQYPKPDQHQGPEPAAGGEISVNTDYRTSPAIRKVTLPEGWPGR